MKKYVEIVLFIAVAVAAYFLIYKKLFSPAAKSREFLHTLGFGIADRMSDGEVVTAASYIRDYTQKGKKPLPGSLFAMKVDALSRKYNIFT